MDTPTKELYGVILLRTDGNHIVIEEFDTFEKAHTKWDELATYWVTCLKEKVPFRVEAPIVTAFDPTFVYEIIIKPKTIKVNSNTSSKNPYYRDMMQNGLTKSLNKNTGATGDLLDHGYSL